MGMLSDIRVAPQATLRFRLLPRSPSVNMHDISLRVMGDHVTVHVPVAPDNSFVLPRNEQALQAPPPVPQDVGREHGGRASTQQAFGRFFTDLAHAAPEVAEHVVVGELPDAETVAANQRSRFSPRSAAPSRRCASPSTAPAPCCRGRCRAT